MYKDQIYLTGAIKVFKQINKLNFINLHSGKISVKDCIKLTEKGSINTNNILIPYFLRDIHLYYKALNRIAKCNFIHEVI